MAENNLGFMYYKGLGVPRDFEQAAKWTRRAAEHGYVIAKTDLGYLYEQGTGVPLDYVSAYMWYSLGASGGDPRASGELKELSKIMSRKQIADAKNRVSSSAPQWQKTVDFPGVEMSGSAFLSSH